MAANQDHYRAPAPPPVNLPRLDAQELEQRILMSAAPLDLVSELAAVEPDGTPPATWESGPESLFSPLEQLESLFSTLDGVQPDPSEHGDSATSRRELIVVDASVEDRDSLLAELSETGLNRDILILDGSSDGLVQISDYLAGSAGYDAVHLLTHGSDASLRLGNVWLNDINASQYTSEFQRWQDALSESADLLIYACDFAGTDSGLALTGWLGEVSGLDVAASIDVTGHASLGGDWDLEYHHGNIETDALFAGAAEAEWQGRLAIIVVDTTADVIDAGDGLTSLREAIIQNNSGSGGDTIQLGPGHYILSLGPAGENGGNQGDLDIFNDVTIVGAGADQTIIDANGLDRVFHIRQDDTVATLSGVTVTGGMASDNGAGFFVDNDSTLNLLDSAVVGNDGTTGRGGAFHVHGTLNLERVLIANNTADEGAGIHFHDAVAGSLINVTISGNVATSEGGGIWTDDVISIQSSTIAFNEAPDGGGIFDKDGDVTIGNSILYNPGFDNANQTLGSTGYNIDSDGTAGLADTGDQSGIDPLLAPLAYNGGTIQSHALLSSSPAIDSGDGSLASTSDSRGILHDSAVDIGAFSDAGLLLASEFPVNETTTDDQITSADTRGSQNAVAMDAAGNYVVVWSSNQSAGGDGDGWSIMARLYDATGQALSDEFLVNQVTSNHQQFASVARAEDGSFVVVWSGESAGSRDIWYRRFDADGNALSGDLNANDTLAGDQLNAAIAMDRATGDFVITWQGEGPGDNDGVFFRRFHADGTAKDAADRIASPAGADNDTDPAIAMQSGGAFVIGWVRTNDTSVRFQRFDGNGDKLGSVQQIDNAFGVSTDLAVASDSAGNFTFLYRDGGLGPGVWRRGYFADGSNRYTWFRVDTGDAASPSIHMLDDGSHIITWEKSGDSDGLAVFGRKFNPDGSSNGGSFLVNQTETGDQSMPSIAAKNADNYVVVWTGNGPGDDNGVFARQYGTAVSAGPAADINSDLVLHLEFEDGSGTTATDSSSFGNDASLASGEADWVDGPVGTGAFHFDASEGAVDYFEVPDSSSLTDVQEADYFSLAAWFRADAQPSSASALDDGHAYGILVKENNPTGIWYTTSGRIEFQHHLQDGSIVTLTSANAYAIETWHHVVVTVDRPTGRVDMFVDGVLENTVSFTAGGAAEDNGTATWKVGTANDDFLGTSASYPAQATIDDVRIYARKIGTTDVAALFALGSPNTIPPLIDAGGPYTFAEGAAWSLDASNSSAANGGSLTYEWDLDNDGDYGDSGEPTSANPVLSWSTLGGFGITDDGNWTIGLRVTDSQGNVSTETVTVAVTNEAPTITSSDSVSVFENTNSVITVAATDPADSTTFEIVGGSDAGRFTIDSATGVLTFVSPPDFEAPTDTGTNNTYFVNVRARDDDGAVSATQHIQVNVLNVNEAPITANDSVSVNSTQTVTLDPTANDSDPEGDSLLLLDVTGATNGLAVVNPDGTVTYQPDTGFSGTDSVQYVVSDGSSSLVHYWGFAGSATDSVGNSDGTLFSAPAYVDGDYGLAMQFDENDDYVRIDDFTYSNEFTLSFQFKIDDNTGSGYQYIYSHGDAETSNSLNIFLGESSRPGYSGIMKTVFGDTNDAYAVNDLNFNASSIVGDGDWHTYTLTVSKTGGAKVYLDGVLRASHTGQGGDAFNPTGDLFLGTREDLDSNRYFGGLLDTLAIRNEALSDAEVAALASSPAGFSNTASGAITFLVDDDPPVANPGGPLAMAEGGSLTLDGTASTDDSGITGYQWDLDNDGVFGESGEPVTATASLTWSELNAFGITNDGIYTIGLQVVDGSGNSHAVTTSLTVSNVAPTFPAVAAIDVFENATAVTTLIASDPVDTLAWSITGGSDASQFVLDSATGALTFVTAPNYENPLDANLDNRFQVTVSASDGSATVSRNLTIRVRDVDEFDVSPISDSDVAANEVAETASTGTTVGLDASAFDLDGTNHTITFSLDNDAAGRFTIDPVTGVVTVADASLLDHESTAQHTIRVRATSADGSATTADFTIDILDVNEHAPVITSDGGGDTATISVLENTTAVTTVQATDADGSSPAVTYTIVGGVDAGAFSINSATGQLTFLSAADFESITDVNGDHIYHVRVRASDGVFDDQQLISVRVQDVDEFDVSPITDSDAAANEVAETAVSGTAVGIDASTFDLDGSTNTITFSLDNDAAGRFTIDPATGVVTVADASLLDHESTAQHTIRVRATSADGSSVSRNFAIDVLDVNDNAPVITSNGGGDTATISLAENTTAVTVVQATDADVGAPPLTYSIVGGIDASAFIIDGTTGHLSFSAAPDFESASDGNGDNIYHVRVRVTDGLLNDEQLISVRVLDSDEFDVSTPVDSDARPNQVTENAASGTLVGIQAQAFDSDGSNNTVTWSLTDNAGGRFAINAATGVVVVADASRLNYEIATTHTITVQATSADGSISSADMTIQVRNINESPVIAVNTGLTVGDDQDRVVITSAMLKATDQDDSAGELTYTITGSVEQGNLLLNGVQLESGDTFTQADINQGNLTYAATPGAIINDGFAYSLADGGEDGSQTVHGVFKINSLGPVVNNTDASEDTEPDSATSSDSENPVDETSESQGPAPSNDSGDASPQSVLVGGDSGTSDAVRSDDDGPFDISLNGADTNPFSDNLLGGVTAEAVASVSTAAASTGESLSKGGTAPSVSVAAAWTAVTSYDVKEMQSDLNQMRQQMAQFTAAPVFAAGSVAGATGALTVGYVLWTIRSGLLVTSLLAQMPAWRLIDPLVVLNYLDELPEDGADGEDDSLQALLEKSNPSPESTPSPEIDAVAESADQEAQS